MSVIQASTSHEQLGINNAGLMASITAIRDNIEALHTIFNSMEEIVMDSSSYMVGEEGDVFRNKFLSMKYYFPVVESNIDSYVEDLTNLLNNYIVFEGAYKPGGVDDSHVNSTTGVNGY